MNLNRLLGQESPPISQSENDRARVYYIDKKNATKELSKLQLQYFSDYSISILLRGYFVLSGRVIMTETAAVLLMTTPDYSSNFRTVL